MCDCEGDGRQFCCDRCGRLTVICSGCDRGNRYCGPECARASRAETCRNTSRRHQRTPHGRRNHRRRQKLYRLRVAARAAAELTAASGAAAPSVQASPPPPPPAAPRSASGRPCASATSNRARDRFRHYSLSRRLHSRRRGPRAASCHPVRRRWRRRVSSPPPRPTVTHHGSGDSHAQVPLAPRPEGPRERERSPNPGRRERDHEPDSTRRVGKPLGRCSMCGRSVSGRVRYTFLSGEDPG